MMKVRAVPQFETPTTFLAPDEFNQAAGALTGKAAAAGETWTVVASSDADDFQAESTGNTAQRTAVSDAVPRMVTVGTTAYAAIAGQVDLKANVITTSPMFGLQGGVLVRGGDIDDYVMAGTVSSGTTEQTVGVVISVASNAVAHSVPYRLQANAWYTTRIVVDTSGRWAFWFHPKGRRGEHATASGPAGRPRHGRGARRRQGRAIRSLVRFVGRDHAQL